MLAIYYYKETMNDTMSIVINNNKPTKFDHQNDYTMIYHDDILVGINIFNVSKNIELPNGFLYADDKILSFIKKTTKMDLTTYNNPQFIVGRVDVINPIANSHLRHCLVFNGFDQTSVVCGASNFKVGDKVVLANAGAALPSGSMIYPSKMFDIQSNGMLCSKKELFNTEENSQGLLILNNQYEVGQPYLDLYKNFGRK